jgi:murein L,D-transpeptidase YcbB/YkuD
MLREVQAFQREQRLAPDGIIGVRTQMVLDAVADTQGVPLLDAGEVD